MNYDSKINVVTGIDSVNFQSSPVKSEIDCNKEYIWKHHFKQTSQTYISGLHKRDVHLRLVHIAGETQVIDQKHGLH